MHPLLLALSATALFGQPAPHQIPTGKWHVLFANGVSETCEISGLSATEVEPRRSSTGTAVVEDESVVITFQDDRVERWTPVGSHYVVEHWYPGSRRSSVTPVLGIAERVHRPRRTRH